VAACKSKGANKKAGKTTPPGVCSLFHFLSGAPQGTKQAPECTKRPQAEQIPKKAQNKPTRAQNKAKGIKQNEQ